MTAAGDLSKVAGELEQYPQRAVRYAVDAFRRPLVAELRRDTGGDNRLSGVGAHTRLTVKTDVIGSGGAVLGTVTAWPRKVRGLWRWLDAGTRPRQHGAGRHPGTRAKDTWAGPVRSTIPAVEQHLAGMFDEATR